MVVRSADLLTNNILSDPNLVADLKTDPGQVLRQQAAIATAGTPLETDRVIYRIVVGSLGGVLIIVALGLILLALKAVSPVPDGLVAIGSAAVGALAGLLAPSPSTSRP